MATPASEPALSGQVTFDYVPSEGGKLMYEKTEARPVRGAPLEVVDQGGEVLRRLTTDAQGRYSTTVPAGRTVLLRVLAQVDAAGTPVQVTDNTQSGALYAVESGAFTSDAGTASLHAASGWTGSAYEGKRAAAPFAILDTVYRAQSAVLAVEPGARLKPLALHWSPANKAAAGDPALGQITISHFAIDDGKGHIYILGDADVDTDEYDESVVAHEWGHYYQWAFSRDDSIGGSHAGEPLEMTVAFSEGWGHGWAAIVTGKSALSDSQGPGQADGWSFLIDEVMPQPVGWFNEMSVANVVYKLAAQVGFAPVHAAMRSLAATPAFTSIHAFSDALRKGNPDAADILDPLLAAQSIVTSRQSGDAFGTGEANAGGLAFDGVPPEWTALPVYLPLQLDVPARVCSVAPYGVANKHGNHRFVRFDAPVAGKYRFTAVGLDRGDGTSALPIISALQAGTRNWLFVPPDVRSVDLDLVAGPNSFSVTDVGVLRGLFFFGCIDLAITNVPNP